MAECFWPGLTEAKVREAGTRATRAASRDGDAVRYLGAILVPADEVAFCLFEGGSAEFVRTVSERAEIPFERILETVRLDAIRTAINRRPTRASAESARSCTTPLEGKNEMRKRLYRNRNSLGRA